MVGTVQVSHVTAMKQLIINFCSILTRQLVCANTCLCKAARNKD